MIFRKKSFLGLVLGERSMVIAQVFLRGKSSESGRVAEWSFPEDVPDGEPRGRALQQFLKAQRIPPAPAVIGIPASWLLVKEKKTTASNGETLVNLLKSESEQDFKLPPAELVLDYVKSPLQEDDNSRRLTLLAAGKSRLESVIRMAHGAGLKTIAVTPSALSVANRHKADTGFAGLYLSKETAELAVYSGGIPVLIKHLAKIPSGRDKAGQETVNGWIPAISGEMKKLFMLLPDRENSPLPSEILLWDNCGLSEAEFGALKNALPLPVKTAYSSNAAVLLAQAAGHPQTLAVNFLHTRMAVQKKFRWRKTSEKSAVVFVVILLAITAGIVDIHRKELAVDKLRRQIKSLGPELTDASAAIGYVTAVNEWQGRRYLFHECLREITLAFPVEGRIWVTSLSIREDMRGLLSGKASDSKAVLELIDRLKKNAAFSDVTLVYIRHAGGDSGDIVYAVNFIFDGDAENENLSRRAEK